MKIAEIQTQLKAQITNLITVSSTQNADNPTQLTFSFKNEETCQVFYRSVNTAFFFKEKSVLGPSVTIEMKPQFTMRTANCNDNNDTDESVDQAETFNYSAHIVQKILNSYVKETQKSSSRLLQPISYLDNT